MNFEEMEVQVTGSVDGLSGKMPENTAVIVAVIAPDGTHSVRWKGQIPALSLLASLVSEYIKENVLKMLGRK